jgi:hypothetical protein
MFQREIGFGGSRAIARTGEEIGRINLTEWIRKQTVK